MKPGGNWWWEGVLVGSSNGVGWNKRAGETVIVFQINPGWWEGELVGSSRRGGETTIVFQINPGWREGV